MTNVGHSIYGEPAKLTAMSARRRNTRNLSGKQHGLGPAALFEDRISRKKD
jgi:hypothetical protein